VFAAKKEASMAPNKSPAQVMAEQRARRSISERYVNPARLEQNSDYQDRIDRSPPRPVEETFLHRGDDGLAEAIIKKQLADEEEAERLKDATVSEVVDLRLAGFIWYAQVYAPSQRPCLWSLPKVRRSSGHGSSAANPGPSR
jgi:hypothetical protein